MYLTGSGVGFDWAGVGGNGVIDAGVCVRVWDAAGDADGVEAEESTRRRAGAGTKWQEDSDDEEEENAEEEDDDDDDEDETVAGDAKENAGEG